MNTYTKIKHSRLKRFIYFPTKYIGHNWARLLNKDIKWNGMVLSARDKNAITLYYSGQLSEIEEKLTKYFLKNLKPKDVLYDVGASYGFYSQFKCEIHTFEPNPTTFSYLKQNTSIANPIALSNKNGLCKFYDTTKSGHSGGSSLIKKVPESFTKSFTEIEVKCMTLDRYAENHNKPTYIKIDVEGAEDLVLEGATETLKRRPIIALEVAINPDYGEFNPLKAARILYKAGYKSYKIDENGDLHLVEKITAQDVENIRGRYGYDNFVFK